jgi:probable H4MPT-linked C1 transfer pathway protein
MATSITEHVLLLGMDIGGVNIKCSSVPWKDVEQLGQASSTKRFFPLWEKTFGELREQLVSVINEHLAIARGRVDGRSRITVFPCASITGELSDAFSSKKEGIECITSSLSGALGSAQQQQHGIAVMRPRFVATDGTLKTMAGAVADHRAVSAANWYATAAWVGSFEPDCILVDCGSTTTDIIPISNGKPAPEGATDIDRLRSGELVYTGVLRATIPSVAHVVPVHGEPVPVSFEKFALMADVHLILGNISREQYDCGTADGRSTSIEDCKKRLARTVCEDVEELGDDVIREMAMFLADAQARMVQDGLERAVRRCGRALPCVLTGLGETSLALQAAKRAGFNRILSLAEKIGNRASILSSSIGVLHVLATHLKGAGFDGW